jgi:hypothetical protein
MPTIFLSPYKSEPLNDSSPVGCGKAFAQLQKALEQNSWPYDGGDDPSFFCRNQSGSALTWGVCRADVRAQLEPGDIVVFFSFSLENPLFIASLDALVLAQLRAARPQMRLDFDPMSASSGRKKAA